MGDLAPYREPSGRARVLLGLVSLVVAGVLGLVTLREVTGRWVERGGGAPAPPPASELDRAPVLDIEVEDAERGPLRQVSGHGVEAGSPESFVWRTWSSDHRSGSDLLVDVVGSARDRGARFHRLTCGRTGSQRVVGTQTLDSGLTVAVEVTTADAAAGEVTLRVTAGSSPTVGGPVGGVEVAGDCPAGLAERVGG